MRTDLDLTPLGTLEAFREGTAGDEAAHTLAAAVDLAAVLARDYTDEVQVVAAAGLKAVGSIFAREAQSGSWGCSGDEYRAVRAALILSSDLQCITTRRGVAKAINQVLREACVA
jgi:hypothetical protein